MDQFSEAVVMRAYGGPDVLAIEDVVLGALKPDEVRVRMIAAAVNHSDLEIRAGNYPIKRDPPFPYVPGLELIGDIVEVGSAVTGLAVGERVITMMQSTGGLRAKRNGGYARFANLPQHIVARVPTDLDPLDLAALGLAAVTAYEGLRKLGAIEGRRVVVTGASGGVGSVAVAIAAARGAEVVGIVSRAERAPYVRSLGAQAVQTANDVERGALGEEGIDGVLDTVGGTLFAPCVNALRPGGTLSMVGAIGGGEVTFDAYRLLEVTLTGYSSESLDGASLRVAMNDICGWLRDGRIRPPAHTLFPLREAAQAHATLERRGVEGRLLLVPDR
ncbi:MAG TPA: zinc-binding alcohol dehydrogenase family protein [Xanthobacteraceae bacterium]|nr:zinc-binding alcohol dehydrogenase family protein [Xanthobacteraceae bacterium]